MLIAEKIVQYLIDARNTEAALKRLLQAHVAVTARGDYRKLLLRHQRQAERRADRVEERLRALAEHQRSGQVAVGTLQGLIGQGLGLSKGPLDLVRGGSGEEKVVRNAKAVWAAEALCLVSYDALEALSRRGGDTETAALAAECRDAQQRLVAELRGAVPALVAAAAQADCAPAEATPV